MEKIDLKREKLDFNANEAYKSLRTNIQFCGNENRVIFFTSCTPQEGKSTVSFNLAVSFAEMGKKVILIDADLRKSVLVGRYKIGSIEGGLTHYLSGQKKLKDIICNTDISTMDIIFAGTLAPNPAELLENERFSNMISCLRVNYDYIIIDTPPLGSVIDSAVVAKAADGVIMVIKDNAISYRFAQKIKKQLQKSNCKILGVVLNKVKMDKKSYYGRYNNNSYWTYE